MTEEKRYSIGELEHMTGIKRRTIHHYISQGLLPPAVGSGPSAYYLQEHFLRLRLISLLGNVVRTDKIKRALDLWSEDEMQRMVDLAEGRRVRDLDTLRSWLGRSWETKEDEPGGAVRSQETPTFRVSEQQAKTELESSRGRRMSWGRSEPTASAPAPPDGESGASLRDLPAGYMPQQLVMGSIRQLDATAPERAVREPVISTWHRHRVHPDLEIQFRRRKDDRMFEKRLGELIAVASRLFAGFRDREEEANNDPQIEGEEKDHDEE